MRRSLYFLLLSSIIYMAIYKPAVAQGCTSFMQSEPNATLTSEVAAKLIAATITVDEIVVSTYREICFDETSGEAQTTTDIATDFDLSLTLSKLTDMTELAQRTTEILQIVKQFPPETTPGPQAGLITLHYHQVDGGSTYLQVDVTTAAEILTQGLTGEALMTALGYHAAGATTAIMLDPTAAQLSTCTETAQTIVKVAQVEGLYSSSVELTFDPTLLAVVDADSTQSGVQVTPLADYGFMVINQVDNSAGTIQFATSLMNLSGDEPLFEMTWQIKAAGESPLLFTLSEMVDTDSNIIPHVAQQGSITIASACNVVNGMVTLQGRTTHQGIALNDSGNQQTVTANDGSFSLIAEGVLTASYPGYLTAEATLSNANTPLDVGRITLLAGDINGDNSINIFDLSYMGAQYDTTDEKADLNGDGLVNILDLALAGRNYDQRGPLTEWE